MWYSIVISVLLVACLVLYFVLSRKLKMPTVATEIMTTKYNKKISKLERFCKVNGLRLEKDKLCSKLENDKLTAENLIANIKSIQAISQNFEGIEDVYVSADKKEAQDKIDGLKSVAPIKIFADELEINKSIYDLFETFNIGFTKLDFEFQKYFGSQNCINLDDRKLIFLPDNQLVVVNSKNIFECKHGNYELTVSKRGKDKKNKSAEDIYALKLLFGGEELLNKEVLVESKNVKKYLEKSEFFKK